MKDIAVYADSMAIKEKEIRENPKYNKKGANDDSKLSTPLDAGSKYGNGSEMNKSNNNNDDLCKDGNSMSPDSSVNVSQLNKTARVQFHMSILQRNFMKIGAIFKQMVELLVKESGESTNTEHSTREDCKFNYSDSFS